jgi:hypothetical protein
MLRAADKAAYEAAFADGTRVTGKRVFGWGTYPLKPRLDSTSLHDEERPLMWLRNNSVKPWRIPEDGCAYVEFIGGDRIIGSITEIVPASDADGPTIPTHLLVTIPRTKDQHQQVLPLFVRVLPKRIERAVFHSVSPRPLQPGTLFRLDGGRLTFRLLRWKKNSVSLLLEDGTMNVNMADIAEIHFPRTDSWQAYYDELALFSPDCKTPLTRVETTSGLTATFGETRFRALAYATPSTRDHFARQRAGYEERITMHNGHLAAVLKELEQARKEQSDKAAELLKATPADREACEKELAKSKEELDKVTVKLAGQEKHLAALKARHAATEGGDTTWVHVIQPIWSLDCLHVPFSVINVRLSCAPNLVPLCRIRPVSAVSPPFLPWSMNRNSKDQPLSSCGKDYGWGFAVHAYSELRFVLPDCAEAFRGTAGIDSIVGSGGCARARVYLGSVESKPLFESPLLIGLRKTADTSRLTLLQPPEGPKQLVLQADPVIHNYPPDADPLNIRDNLDWLDPSIELDSAVLQKLVRQRIGPLIAGSRGWTVGADPRDIDIRTCYLPKYSHSGIESSHLLALVQPLKQPLLLSRKMLIGPSEKYLAVYLSSEHGYSPGSHAVTLSVDKKQIKPRKIPIRQDWQDWPSPLLFQLDEYQGRTVTLELAQRADRKPLHWRAITTSKELPSPYHIARLLEEAGHGNLQITRQLGAELRSHGMDDQGKRALISVYQNGGIMGYSGQLMRSLQTGDTHHIFVGEDWNGGDKSFAAFQTIPILESLTVIRSSGVSDSAVKKLQEVKPGLEIEVLEKLPETREQRCTFWMQNHTGKEVRLMWDSSGTLTHRDTLHGRIGRKKHHSNIGVNFEAHVHGKCVSRFTVTPGRIWNIRLEE